MNGNDKNLSRSNIMGYGITDKGMKRDHNEDDLYFSDELGIFIVSDGVGGHQAGEMASSMAVSLLPDYVRELKKRMEKLSLNEINNEIKKIFLKLNREVFEKSMEKDEYRGMGCTIVLAFTYDKFIYIANIGDSRAYLLRKHLFKQITIDHSLVGNLVLIGQISPSDARKHPMKHIITKHIGMEEDVFPDIYRIPFIDGDRILLATDGLNDMLSDRAIAKRLAKDDDLETISRDLVDMANRNGGEDNITVLIIQKGKFNADIYKKRSKIKTKYRQIKTKNY